MYLGMYRVFQFFVLAIKIDIFIEFLVSLFYFIQFAIETPFTWQTWVQLVIMVLILPVLYFGRMAVASESYGRMILFIAFQFVIVFAFILMLRQTLEPNNYWYVWICFGKLLLLCLLLFLFSMNETNTSLYPPFMFFDEWNITHLIN